MTLELPIPLDHLFRRAVRCASCFDARLAAHALIDIPQPRWVGPTYFSASRRIVITLVNPGAGSGHKDDENRHHRALLEQYRRGEIPIDAIFAHQRRDIANWGGRAVDSHGSTLPALDST